MFFFFFFQAEDGIRDKLVTGVQTCALPISDDGKTISDAALRLWEGHRPRLPIRLVGVSAAGIVGDASAQLALFAAGAHRRRAALNQALDAIVARFGMESIGRGGAGRSEKRLTTRLKRGE